MARDTIVWLRENWTDEENREFEENAKRWRAEHPTMEELQRKAYLAQIELRDLLLGAPPADPKSATAAPPPPDEAALAARRGELLTQWEAVTDGKRSHLYKSRNGKPPVISKNQFYSWLNGKLSPGRKAGRRLEFFLRQQIGNDGSRFSRAINH